MLAAILVATCVFCYLAYRIYGGFLSRHCRLDDERETPASSQEDGVDYVPTRASVLFGHHFSSIAGAGPIVGPILAATYFGWGPTWAWILVGAVLVGGVHDFGSTLMSVRNGGRSIADTMRNLLGEGAGKLFLVFVVLALIYVIIVFLDLTANTFQKQPEVATASTWFIVTALAFGWVLLRKVVPLGKAIWVFIPLTFVGLAVGHYFPAPDWDKQTWVFLTLGYCYVAAILPVSVLLQPRDFLSAGFLYAILGFGLFGMLFANESIQLDAYISWETGNSGMLFPFLFITVACGACSGFHSIVSSGTTSKQIRRESDVTRIGYGSMLVEGVLAVFAMGCVVVLTTAERESGGGPVGLFAVGAAKFFHAVGIPVELGKEFAMLAISTFLLTTLDTCTRLTRFLFEELLDWRNVASRYLGTLLALVGPAFLVFQTFPGPEGKDLPVWKAIWPLFGATNQLLAALALLTFVVFLKASKVSYGFALLPAVVMIVMPMTALAMMTQKYGFDTMLGSVSAAMFLLGFFLIILSWRYLTGGSAGEPKLESPN